MFKTNYQKWIDNAKDFSIVDTYIAVNNEGQKKEILNDFPNVDIKVIGENLGVCKPIYEITKDLKGKDDDILIGVFDDVSCIPNWDEYLLNYYKDYTGALLINDGVQHYGETVRLVAISMPVMDIRTLKQLNRIIFHPEYKHYFADNEVYFNLKELGLLWDIRKFDKTIFQHEHYWIINKRKLDAIDQQIIDNCGDYDRIVYEKRMKLPLQKRLEV